MSLYRLFTLGLISILTFQTSGCSNQKKATAEKPDRAVEAKNEPDLRVFSYPVTAIQHTRKRILASDPALQPALNQLIREADALLGAPILSVVNKSVLPVSGNPHDFFSFGPYWWPNPDTPDGLPYVRRDGERNPASRGADDDNLSTTARGVFTLGLAYYFTGNEHYARNAADRLRVWFLDPETKMTPHLEYAQAIPGHTDGRSIGIIGTQVLIPMIDGIGLIAGSPAWTPQLEDGMQNWLGSYLDWLLTSAKGQNAGQQFNNHGTYYDAQVTALALFTKRLELARQVTADAIQKRLLNQVDPDGSQPHEMDRTLSMTYSAMNAEGFLFLAAQSEAAGGIDWWAYESPKGVSLSKVIAFMAVYTDENIPWPKKDIRQDNVGRRRSIRELTARAAAQNSTAALLDQVRAMAAREEFLSERWHLYLPVEL